MATPIIQTALVTGEVSPALFGHVDLVRMHSAASTMRNFWPSYRGGAYSRAGTEYVGFSKQTGRAYPPRLIPFQFSINQGLALEFGNYYMRVIFNGGYVTEAPYVITAATKANPCVLTVSATSSLDSVVPINSAVSASYVSGDTVSLAGGTFTTRGVVTVGQTLLASVAINARGSNYNGGDLISLSGGGAVQKAVVQVVTTRVASATIFYSGTGGTPGPQTLTGTTGTGTKWQANVTVNGSGQVSSINSIAVQGSYTANPSSIYYGPNRDDMSGGGFVVGFLTTPVFNVVMEISTIIIANPGQYTINSSTFTQFSTTGSGSGATFQTGVFGIYNATVTTPGNYSVLPSNPVAQFGTSGTGAGVTFTATWEASPTLATGDWMFVDDVEGMTELNGRTFVVSVSGASLTLFDVYGNQINSTAYGTYTSGGTASRIYTLDTQYSEADLKWIKYTQSADTMSLCCINQDTGMEYAPVDLARTSDNDWTFTPAVPTPSISPPTLLAIGSSTQPASPTTDAGYAYVVTAVAEDGTESIASNIGTLADVINIASTAGTITVNWRAMTGVNEYNIYKATPVIQAHGGGTGVPAAGALFGYAGSAYGVFFSDNNIVPDFSQVPPRHRNPFARGQVTSLTPTAFGSGYTSNPTITINTSTGAGAVIQPILSSTGVSGYIIQDPGANYVPTDTVTISGGGGSGATATLNIGAQTGTYPGVVAYFQQRRFYAYTLNQPDTYFASQPGAFTNFDRRIPTIDSDAFDGTPWSVQVNGIQFMVPTSGGLVVLTGLEAYFLTGQGGSAFTPAPLTPSSQSAVPQGFNGCAATIPPVRIYQDVLYVQAKGSKYRNFSFNMNQNTYTGDDITQNSAHLFDGYTMVAHAWCEEPYRLLWAVRNDGIMLSVTWDKAEKVCGWARHDTFGTFESVCSVTEPPVDALYVATQRFLGDETAYVVERMNDRLWQTAEDVWCVDCGLSYSQDAPDATLSADSADGIGSLTGVTNLVGGSGYSAGTTAVVVDDNGLGPGSGAVVQLTIVGGVITAVAFTSPGAGYVSPKLSITDPAGSDGGSGASADITLNDTATFTASASVFVVGDVGRIIRMGGGVATILTRTSGTVVTAQLTSPIRSIIPNSGGMVQPAASGDWTLSTATTTVGGLWPLVGATVTGVADGVAIEPQEVSATGTITLDTAASQITVGLAYLPQLQSVYLENEELQGQRKKVAQVTARVQASGDFTIGSNQPDGSVQSPIQIAPTWQNMTEAPNPAVNPYNSVTKPLFTGDIRIPVGGGFGKPGQIAIEQPNPYPIQVLALVPEVLTGDTPSQKWPEKQQRGRG